MDAAILTNLIPASVWKRDGKKGPTTVTVLFITNTDIPEEQQAKFPPQVVFRTNPPKGREPRVQSMGIERFLANRSFHDMDQDIDAILAVLTASVDEEEEEVDIDSLELDGPVTIAGIGAADEAEDVAVNESSDEEDSEVVLLDSNGPQIELPEPHKALESAFVGYSETAFGESGNTLHILKFGLGEGITLASLREAFDVALSNSVQKTTVTSTSGDVTTNLDIDAFIEVFLESTDLGDFGLVHVLTEGDIRALAAASSVVVQEVPVAQVAVSANPTPASSVATPAVADPVVIVTA